MIGTAFNFESLRRGVPTASVAAFVLAITVWLGICPPAAVAQLNIESAATKGMDVVEHLGKKAPLDLEFLDPEGKTVRLGESFNQGHRPVVLALVYFRCPLMCPMVLNNLQSRANAIKQTIGEDYNVVLVTFDPQEGPAEARQQQLAFLAGYEREHPKDIEKSFQVLSGRPDNASVLAEALGFPYRYLPESGEFSHGTVFFVLTPDGTISRYIYGVNYPAETLRMALLEASEGKVGSAFERVIMWCFHFDPKSGAYTLRTLMFVNIASTLSALGVGAFLTRMVVVERRRRRLTISAIAAIAQPVSPVLSGGPVSTSKYGATSAPDRPSGKQPPGTPT